MIVRRMADKPKHTRKTPEMLSKVAHSKRRVCTIIPTTFSEALFLRISRRVDSFSPVDTSIWPYLHQFHHISSEVALLCVYGSAWLDFNSSYQSTAHPFSSKNSSHAAFKAKFGLRSSTRSGSRVSGSVGERLRCSMIEDRS